MPTDGYTSPVTGLLTWQVDPVTGTTYQAGPVVSGDGVILTAQANPAPTVNNQLRLYTPDGLTFTVQTAAGTTAVFQMTGQLNLTGAATSTTLVALSVTGDTNARYIINADDTMGWGPGNAGTDTNLYRGAAGILQTDARVQVTSTNAKAISTTVAGGGLSVKEGTNARMGAAVLVGGTVTVANTSVTATTRIFLTSNADGGTPGFVRVSARTAGTNFTITSSSGTDTSTIAWLLVEPN